MFNTKEVNKVGVLILILVAIASVGVAVWLVVTPNRSTDLLSFASKRTVVPTEMSFSVQPIRQADNGLVTIKASWDPQSTIAHDPNLILFGMNIRDEDGVLQTIPGNGSAGKATSKTITNLPLVPGHYVAILNAVYKDTVKQQQINFEVTDDQSKIISVIKNPGFEKIKSSSNPNDLDPADWETAEGLMWGPGCVPGNPNPNRPCLPNGEGGTERIEHPEMVQVVPPTPEMKGRNSLGQHVLKNATALGLKSHVVQFYQIPAVNEGNVGTFVQKLMVYVPKQAHFLQQMEIRKGSGGEQFQIRWTDQHTRICLRGDTPAGDLKAFCKELPVVPFDAWQTYEFRFEKLPQPEFWRVKVHQNNEKILETGKNGVGDLRVHKQLGFLFIGDECQFSGKDNQGENCDGQGTMYFDNADAYYVKP